MGPKEARSTVLTPLEEAIVLFRQQTLLPLDGVLFALQPQIPHLIRSSLHRLLERHGISGCPRREHEVREEALKKISYRLLPHRYLRSPMRGRQAISVRAVDQTSKFTYAELHHEATRSIAAQVLANLIEAVLYQIDTVLTNNGIQFTHKPGTATYSLHSFDRVCQAGGIEHRLTRPNGALTNGQIEQMNRTIKEAMVRAFHYASADQLKQHLHAFLSDRGWMENVKSRRVYHSYGDSLYSPQCWIRAAPFWDKQITAWQIQLTIDQSS